MNITLQDGEPEKTVLIRANLTPQVKKEITKLLREFSDIFAWSHTDMPGIDLSIISQSLSIDLTFREEDRSTVNDMKRLLPR